MADLDQIRKRIAEIARRRKNVTLSEIEWIVRQSGEHGYTVHSTDKKHGKLFQVDSQTFMVNHHNPGNKQVKWYSVNDFISVYSDEADHHSGLMTIGIPGDGDHHRSEATLACFMIYE